MMNTVNISKQSELKVLKDLVSKTNVGKRLKCVLITHVLPTSESYIRLVNQVFDVSLVIAIPYAADQHTLDKLNESGFRTFLPATVDAAFTESGPLVEEVLKESNTPLIVQEVGGYLAGYTKILKKYPHFKGIVEDTNNGHWRYEKAGEHFIPVVSMAQSPIKDIEDTVIGDSVVYSAERILREEFNAVIQGARAGVIGYGKIGTSTTIALKGRESSVTVYDVDPAKCIRARFEGTRISPLSKLLSESELVIGCTGKTSVREEEIPFIRNEAILVSGSAKDEEFDLTAFDRLCTKIEINSVVWKYIRSDGSCFYVLNKGTPVNFRDRSILGCILDMIYSELFLCMVYIANEEVPSGLQHSPSKIHNEVAKGWLRIYESSFSEIENDKIWDFSKSSSLDLTQTFMLQMKACTTTDL